MFKSKKIAILILTFIGFFQSAPALAHWSKIPGSTFPNTCAASMAFVPEGDASWDTHNGGKSYVFSEEYKNAVSAWKTANLTAVTIANASTDHLGLPIYVHKDASAAFTNFGKDILNCEEIKQGLYSIEIFDNFACRLITKGTTLSPHASGDAIDINVTKNKYHTGQCASSDCDFSPCFLAALKKNGLSWGGPGDSLLFPGTCDTQHIQWNGGASNIQDSNLNFCALKPEIAALYGAGTTLPTGEVVKSVTIDTGIPLINEVNLILQKPETKIGLPGLDFSDIKAVEEDGGQFLYIPFLGEYIAAIYKYAIVAASIFAVVMIINQGFAWAISGGEPEKINHAKTRIMQSIVGLFLAVGSYILLYTINPNLVSFKSLRVQYVAGHTLTDMEGLNMEFGTDMTDYSKPYSAASESATITSGGFRDAIKASCGDALGFSLPTLQERQKRMVQIVKSWKKQTVDNGGAIYYAGGYFDCRFREVAVDYGFAHTSVSYSRTPEAIPSELINALNTIPLKNGETCGSLFSKVAQNMKSVGPTTSARKKAAFNTVHPLIGPFNLDKKGKESMELSLKPCSKVIGQIYDTIIGQLGRSAQMICGDCASFVHHIFTSCFDKRRTLLDANEFITGYIKHYPVKCGKGDKYYSNEYSVSKDFKSKIPNIIQNLQFGDIIRMEGHTFLYTGKSGDPEINYEIMEMGGYGTSNKQTGEDVIKNRYNIKYNFSAVTVHKSMAEYLEKNVFGKHPGTSLCVSRPLDPKNIPQL